MNFTKVITHDTGFHADDVMAVALLKEAGFNFELIRTRNPDILKYAIEDPIILVTDVGGVFDPKMLNFDHHQDMSLPSAAGMIWNHFKDSICPPDAQVFFSKFIASIDSMDTNRDNIYATWKALPLGFRNTSDILGGFNRDVKNSTLQYNQFNLAVDLARIIIKNEVFSAEMKAQSEILYKKRQILPNGVAVFDEFSTIWREKQEHQFAVLPHANGWQIQSFDTSVVVVPETVSKLAGFVFRHPNGFMAAVKDKNVVIEFAKTL